MCKQLCLLKVVISSNQKRSVYAEYSMLVETELDLFIPLRYIEQCYNCAVSQFRKMHGIYPFIARHHSDDWFNKNANKLFSVSIQSIHSTGKCMDSNEIYNYLVSFGYSEDYNHFCNDNGFDFISKLHAHEKSHITEEIASAFMTQYDIHGNELGKYYRLNSDYDEWLRSDGYQKYKVGDILIHNGNGLKCEVVKYYEPFDIIGWDSRCCEVYYPELDQYVYENVSNFTKEK